MSHRPATDATLSRRRALTGLAGILGLGATGCSTAGGAPASTPGGTAGGFPLELASCGTTLRFPAPPQRIVLLESSPLTTLEGLGALERVVARAGAFPSGYYSEDLAARLEAIPALSEDMDATGHLQITQELVIAQAPDLVLGLPDGLTRETLHDAGAEVLVQEGFCSTEGGRASFESLHREIATYGQILDRPVEAQSLVTALQERIDAVFAEASSLRTGSAAVLYPSLGGGPLYAYGAGSMATAQLDALGIENVFADTEDRVFEVSSEPLLAADPDVLLVLHQSDGDGSEVAEAMIAQDQLAALRAVQEEAVLPLLFNFTEPASPLVVDGLERIHEWLREIGR